MRSFGNFILIINLALTTLTFLIAILSGFPIPDAVSMKMAIWSAATAVVMCSNNGGAA